MSTDLGGCEPGGPQLTMRELALADLRNYRFAASLIISGTTRRMNISNLQAGGGSPKQQESQRAHDEGGIRTPGLSLGKWILISQSL